MKTLLTFILGLIAAPLVLALVGLAGWLPSSSISEPPKWEAGFGMRALDSSLERRARGLSNPIQPNDKAAIAVGAKIYASNCSGCHGDGKGPSNWGAKGLYPRAPQFFEGGADVTAREAYAAIHDGVRYSGMGAWSGQLKDDEIWKVANFLTTIQPKGGKKVDMD